MGEDADAFAERVTRASGQSRAEIISILSVAFSGPHPPPEMLAAYERVVPGLADRLIHQGESQTAHRQAMERELIGIQRERDARQPSTQDDGARSWRDHCRRRFGCCHHHDWPGSSALGRFAWRRGDGGACGRLCLRRPLGKKRAGTEREINSYRTIGLSRCCLTTRRPAPNPDRSRRHLS